MRTFARGSLISAALFALTALESEAVECIENSTCTVNGTTYICDECYGTGVTCALEADDICPGRCNGGANHGALCDEQADCTGGSCNYANGFADGVRTACMGSDPELEFDPDAHVQCLGPDDAFVYHVTPAIAHDLSINAEDGNDFVFVNVSGAYDVYVHGGSGDDQVFALGSAATVIGGPGNDSVTGTSAYGNDPNDFADEGDDIISGTSGADALVGSEGDDYILGSGGNDFLFGQGGRDVMKGGDGNDVIYSSLGYTPDNIDLGSLLCGEAGDDTLIGKGPGHQCMDGGGGQTSSGGSDYDCTYHNFPGDNDATDVGTARNCANPTQSGSYGVFLDEVEPRCGCD